MWFWDKVLVFLEFLGSLSTEESYICEIPMTKM